MSIQSVQCPHCEVNLKIKAEIKKFRCPKCKEVVELSEQDPVSESEEDESPFIASTDALVPKSAPPLPSAIKTKQAMPLPSLSPAGRATEFPKIMIDGPDIDPKACVESGTSFAMTLGILIFGLGILVLIAITWGTALIALLIAPIVNYFHHKKILALIHGSGLKIGPEQFPQIHDCIERFSARLGIDPAPDVYLVEDSVMNAAAVKLGKRNLVLLTDDMIHGCLSSADPRALAFVLGHELGHVALKHGGIVHSTIAQAYKKLSRLDEYTCDRIGRKLVGDPAIAQQGLVLLTVGHHLLRFVNPQELLNQANEVAANKQSKKAEKKLTHPLLFHRIHRIITESKED